MDKTILLTSFTTWEPHQKTNSSDDLLIEILNANLSPSLLFLRQLPVDFELAPQKAIAHIEQHQPDIVVCCGMAERRSKLSVESRAIVEEQILQTTVNLDALIAELTITEISHDAGRFVCNTLYYAILKYLQEQNRQIPCLFVHVPILTPENLVPVVQDFQLILQRIVTCGSRVNRLSY